MRIWLIVFSLFFGASLMADEPEVTINNVVWYYKPEQAFKRIGEYFDGEERTGRKIILRTQEGPRRGLYFIVRMNEFATKLPVGSYFEVDLIQPDRKQPVTKRFDLSTESTPHREVWLGFTGEDIPPEDEPPVAWRVRLFGPEGHELADYPSFLWSKPAGAASQAK